MTLESEAAGAAEDLVPGVVEAKLGMSAAKIVALAVAALLIIALAAYMIWKTFFAGAAAQAKHDVVQAQGQAAISNAGAQAGAAAVPIINNYYTAQKKSDAQTQENRNAILQAPGASASVDPALAAIVRRDICLRASAASLPECGAVLGVHP